MTGQIVKNADSFMAALRKYAAAREDQFAQMVRWSVLTAAREIADLTPVNTGLAIRNYHVSIGAAVLTADEPFKQGEIAGTNYMALGTEPRRAPNVAPFFAEVAALSFADPYQRYVIANAAPDIVGLEYGYLPTGANMSPRSPRGMFATTCESIHARLSGGASRMDL